MAFNPDIDFKLIKPGDIINYGPLDAIGYVLAYCGKYCHTSAIIKVDYGNKVIWIIESHLDTGVVIKVLNPKWYQSIDIRRVDMTNNQLSLFISALHLRLGWKYGLADFRPTIRGLLLSHFGVNIRNNPAWGNDPCKVYCTELIGESMATGAKLELVRNVHHSQLIPSDVGWSGTNARLIDGMDYEPPKLEKPAIYTPIADNYNYA